MSHDHSHLDDADKHRDHARGAHNHSHKPQNFGLAFAAAAALNIAFVIVQIIYGVLANSVVMPFVALAWTITYFDLKLNKDPQWRPQTSTTS